jgi:DNA-binding NarL/FixJ family response regulator
VSIRVLLADDQELVRTGFRLILEEEKDIEVVGEAADGQQAVEETKLRRPDVVLMDVRMPNVDGLEATRRILDSKRRGGPRVLILTTFDLDEYVYEALRAGASGFLLKDAPADQFSSAIRVVAAGESLLAPPITRRLIEELVSTRRHPGELPAELDELTARELEVLKLIARGLSNSEIAEQLVVEQTTVKTHVARVLMKLGLRDRVQAVVFAYEWGVVKPGTADRA